MNCEQAQAQMHERLLDRADGGDWSTLDAHLATCATCAAEFQSLQRTCAALSDLNADAPTQKETHKMWTAIQWAAQPIPEIKRPRLGRVTVKGLLKTGTAVAAVLALAVTAVSLLSDKVSTTFTEISAPLDPGHRVAAGFRSNRPFGESVQGSRTSVESSTVAQPTPPPQVLASKTDRDATNSPTRRRGKASDGEARVQSIFGGPHTRSYELDAVDPAQLRNLITDAPHAASISSLGFLAMSQAGGPQESRDRANGVTNRPAPPTNETAQPQDRRAAPSSAPTNLKIIKTAELAVEVESYAAAAEQVEQSAARFGAHVADAQTHEQSGGAILGVIVIRVPPDRFEPLFAALKSIGRLQSENVSAADVTAEFVDLEARIKSLRITEDRLHELVKSKSIIDKVSALLEVERELTRVRSHIEQYQGSLRVMADRIALSTITITLREPARTVPSASIWLEVPILADAQTTLEAALTTLSAQLESGQTSKRDGEVLEGNHTIKVTLANFGRLLDTVATIGRVKHRIVKDWRSSDADQPWADAVTCNVSVIINERPRQLPSAQMNVEVKRLEGALDQLTSLLSDADGAIASNTSTRQGDGTRTSNLKLSIPAGRFSDLVEQLPTLGRTTAKTVAGEATPITGGAATIPCDISLTLSEPRREVPTGTMSVQIDNFDAARDKLTALVEDNDIQVQNSSSNQRRDGTWLAGFQLAVAASEMETVVARLESLGHVTHRQITGLGLGELSRTDPDAVGVITLSLAEESTLTPGPDNATGAIRSSTRAGIAGLYRSVGFIAYAVIVAAPWILIATLVAWLVWRATRAARARRE